MKNLKRTVLAWRLLFAFAGAKVHAELDIQKHFEKDGYKEVGRSLGVDGISIRILRHPDQSPGNVLWVVSFERNRRCFVDNDFTHQEYQLKMVDKDGKEIFYKKPEFKGGSVVLYDIEPNGMRYFLMDLNKLFHARVNDGVTIEFTWAGWYSWEGSGKAKAQAPVSLKLNMEQFGFESPKPQTSVTQAPTVRAPQVESSVMSVPPPTQPETANQTAGYSSLRFWFAGFLGAIGLAFFLWLGLRKRGSDR